MLFSKGQRGVENVSGQLRAPLVQADAASEGTLAFGAAFVLPGEKLNQILFLAPSRRAGRAPQCPEIA